MPAPLYLYPTDTATPVPSKLFVSERLKMAQREREPGCAETETYEIIAGTYKRERTVKNAKYSIPKWVTLSMGCRHGDSLHREPVKTSHQEILPRGIHRIAGKVRRGLRPAIHFQNGRRMIFRICRPDGAGYCIGPDFYKDAAPTALNIRGPSHDHVLFVRLFGFLRPSRVA
jgi:hypothetical protein